MNIIRSISGIAAASLVIATAPASATYIVTGPAADRTTLVGMLNTYSSGGAWALNAANQLVFAANGQPLNNFATRLNFFNNNSALGRTVDVRQNYPGVLIGAFGPLFNPAHPARTQLLDLGDIQFFQQTAAQEPLLDLESSLILHELSELFWDGAAVDFGASHGNAINEQNAELTVLVSRGQRRGPPDGWRTIAATNTWEGRIPWRDTVRGINGFEVITGRGAFDITQVASGILYTGYSYDGSGHDIAIESIRFEAVPEPSALVLLGLGLAGVYFSRRNFLRLTQHF